MKIHRFIGKFNLSSPQIEIDGETAHQITKVLRLEINEKIELSNGEDKSALCIISEFKGKKVIVKIESLKQTKENIKNAKNNSFFDNHSLL
jgi:16S rRNA U1498 N3-methylase RsmE